MSFPHHSSRLHFRVEEIFKSTEKLPIAGGKKRMANIQLFPRNGLLSLPTTDTDPNTGKNRRSPIFRYSSRLHSSK